MKVYCKRNKNNNTFPIIVSSGGQTLKLTERAAIELAQKLIETYRSYQVIKEDESARKAVDG